MDEADRIYRAIFRRPIPPIVRERFSAAIERMEVDPAEQARYRRVLDQVEDLEALEMISRIQRIHPLLTKRFRIMVHLGETLPENQHLFVSTEGGLARALAAFTTGAFHSTAKLIKGWLILRKLSDE